MGNIVIVGIIAFVIGTASVANGMSILPKFGRSANTSVVPKEESKSERVIRCKGDIKLSDDGDIIGCSENFYLSESDENSKERKATLKERFLGWLGNFKGMLFWALVASIGASFMGFGGIVSQLWSNLFGATSKALKVTVKAIARAKRNGGEYMKELDRAHSADPKVQKKINELRAKTDS